MKTAIKLALIYKAFQILAAFTANIFGILYAKLIYGNTDNITRLTLIPALLLGFIFMVLYMWSAGYLKRRTIKWPPVKPVFLILTVIIYAATMVITSFIMNYIGEWLPNLLEEEFNILQSGWLGIICLTIFAPLVEELVYRKGVTGALLTKYTPGKAILISAFIFGIIHLNPAQSFSAFFIGLLLAWLYYKTGSLIPGIIVHILNNAIAVFMEMQFPDSETQELISDSESYILVACAIIIFIIAYKIMDKMTTPAYPWKVQVNNHTDN